VPGTGAAEHHTPPAHCAQPLRVLKFGCGFKALNQLKFERARLDFIPSGGSRRPALLDRRSVRELTGPSRGVKRFCLLQLAVRYLEQLIHQREIARVEATAEPADALR